MKGLSTSDELAASEARRLPVLEYHCPGEPYAITRSVHLARLAAGYAKCRECPSGEHEPRHVAPHFVTRDTAALVERRFTSPLHLQRLDNPHAADSTAEWDRAQRTVTNDGVRGRFLREIDAAFAARLAQAFAQAYWSEHPRQLVGTPSRSVAGSALSPAATTPVEPMMVLAHDEPRVGAELEPAMCRALRRMGLGVWSVGQVPRAVFWHAVRRLGAQGGVHVSGGGTEAELTFVMEQARPISLGSGLDRLCESLAQPPSRASRQPTGLRHDTPCEAYLADRRPETHALRPLRVVLGCANGPLRFLAETLLAPSACRLQVLTVPASRRTEGDGAAVANEATGEAVPAGLPLVREALAACAGDVGVLVEHSRQGVWFVDETGAVMPPEAIGRRLALEACRALGGGPLVIATHVLTELAAPPSPAEWNASSHGSDAGAQFTRWLTTAERVGGDVVTCHDTLGATYASVCEWQAPFAQQTGGRYWLLDRQGPTCDPLLTVLRLLQCLSRSDARLSAWRES